MYVGDRIFGLFSLAFSGGGGRWYCNFASTTSSRCVVFVRAFVCAVHGRERVFIGEPCGILSLVDKCCEVLACAVPVMCVALSRVVLVGVCCMYGIFA